MWHWDMSCDNLRLIVLHQFSHEGLYTVNVTMVTSLMWHGHKYDEFDSNVNHVTQSTTMWQ